MKKRSRQKSEKQIDRTQAILLIVIIIAIIAIFVIIDNPRALNLGTIVDTTYYGANAALQSEYKTSVGGKITLKFAISPWNGRMWDVADLSRYRYDYDIWNDDINLMVARAPSWLLAHVWQNEVTLQMNKEGTFNYSLRETVVFLQEGNRKMNGTVKTFKVIVGSGINPPTPTPFIGTGGTATVIYDPTDEITVIETPPPAITFQAYDAGTPSPTPGEIKIIQPAVTSVRTVSTPVITPITVQPTVTEDNDLTFVPATDTTKAPVKETAGFEGVLVIISLLICIRMRK